MTRRCELSDEEAQLIQQMCARELENLELTLELVPGNADVGAAVLVRQEIVRGLLGKVDLTR